MPFNFGPFELTILLVLVMIIFGVGKLPQVGRAIGSTIREFRRAVGHDQPDTSPGERRETESA